MVAASCLTLFVKALLKRNSKPTQKQGKGREGGSAPKSPGAGAYVRVSALARCAVALA